MKIRKNYEYDKEQSIGIDNKEITLTKQQFKDECDINNILKLFKDKGILPDMIKENAQYGDFSDVPTYQEAMDIVLHAEAQFGALPSHTRDRFGNSPEKFLEFVSDPKNAEEMVAMGLATKRETPPVSPETPPGKPAGKEKAPPPAKE
jgi:phage internal scaffolding protein